MHSRITAPLQRILPGLAATMALVWVPSLYALSDHNLLYALALIPRSVLKETCPLFRVGCQERKSPSLIRLV